MTVPAQATLFNESVANGVTTSFPYEFMIASANDIAVELDGVVTATGFSVTGVGNDVGGAIVFDIAPANGVKVLRYLNSELSRSSDYQQFGDFNADVANLDFDRLWLALQSIGKSLARAIKMPISTVDDQKITASDSQRANKALKFDGFGNIALSNFDPDEAQQAGADALAAAEVAAQAANSASDSAAVALAAAEAAASNASGLPTQAGNNGKFLKTDGSVASWDDPVPAGSVSSSKMADGAATGAKLGADVALKADIQAQTYKAFTTGGTGTAFTLTPSPAISALASGQEFDVTFHAAAGATPTLAISGLAAKSLKYRDSSGNKQSVNSTQIPSGWRSRVVYDGTDYIVREIPPATSTTLQNEGVGLIWGGALNLGATATYYAQGGGLAAQTVETIAQWPIPPLTRVSGLRVHLSAAPSAGSVVFTVRKNGVDTGITCTISSGQTGSDLAHSEDFLFGEMLSLKVQTSGLSPTTIDFGFSIVTYDYNTGKGKCILPISMTWLGVSSPTQALGAPGASRGLAYTNFLTPMPAMSFDTYLANAASFVRYIGGVSVPSDVGFAGSLFTPVVANNDTFAFNDSSASATALYGSIVPKRHPDYSAPLTTYPPCLMMLTAYAQAQNTTRYFGGYVINDAMTGAEGEIQIPMPPCTLNNLRANASAAFAAGQSNVVTVRKNGADTALTVTLDNANQKNSDTTHSVTFSSGDLFSLKSVTSATAGTKYYNASIEVLA